ncbi:NeuD/PglB/VioB family sugar acetyltransferase [Garciella nitratireducens]|uniref:NeuD/PglB/VioB family sugar acetyltransferase n=1 Tax=Garciella nitratireducens TaxID=218205 RepID=UPI000DE801D9|nr:NeuD/PglB/VioB family sugar acetyltransferase [Garciella nitratireducens]RBP42233.1 sugar O-acyltransferase (sialic acid O-acetyltransferase NeuD family) [Garciella nitratireducens]
MKEKNIYIIGAGTYGEAMYELATLNGYKVKGYYDEDEKKINSLVMGVKVIDKFSELKTEDIVGNEYIVAIGNNKIRNKIMTKINDLGGFTPTLIHPKATISESATIGKGVYIQANAYIWTKVNISDYCIISPNVVIAHHSSLGKACLVSTLTGVGASVTIEDNVFIGMGSTIMTGVSRIGENSIIGAGAVVIKDIEKNSVYAGVPAKKIRDL